MRLILKVFSFDMISKVLVGILGILLIRYMGESEYALYVFYLAVINLVAQTIVITFRRIFILEDLNDINNIPPGNYFIVQLFIVLCISVVGYFIFSINLSVYIIMLLVVTGIVGVEFSKTYFQKRMDFKNFSKIEISKSLTFFMLTLSSILISKFNILAWHVLLLQALSLIVVYIFYLNNDLKITNNFSIENVKYILRKIFMGPQKQLIIYVLFSGFLSQIDILLLKYLSNDYEMATYGSALRYYMLVLLSLNAINTIFLPLINNMKDKIGYLELKLLHKKVVILFLPVIIIGAWVSEWIMPLIDMGRYPDAVVVFRILSLSVILSLVFSPYATIVMKYEKFSFLSRLTFLIIIFNILTNIIFIPQFGSIGVSLVTLISFGISNFITYMKSSKNLDI